MVAGSSSDHTFRPPLRRILVSACLMGENVRYDGGNLFTDHSLIRQWRREGRLVSVCPEMAGGLPVPRPAAETHGGDGRAVLAGQARVIARDGDDVTSAFVAGADTALETARDRRCVMAIMAARSPSCGNREIYDGRFSGRLVAGQGTAAARLAAAGIPVFNQHELEEAAAYLHSLG
ncbi:DUF523 domain-containing protein [Marinobacter halodurans]|uniref:DUF523 domain-containing protein n=2 Tax=Marinobacter halodurans TaxID=2528979 RepID=A0ABY1ZLD4_9GAMM|nr:DUF523 domain-containing protein [Marinobacter halodurans]TBW56281.1 DUF523 domain-containing protein [Marinobacter halodurans]